MVETGSRQDSTGQESGSTGSDGASPAVAKLDIAAGPAAETDGYESDDERPTKRVRADFEDV